MDMETELAQEMHQEPSFPSTEFIPTEEAETPIVSGLHKLRDPRTLVVIAVIGLFFLGMIAFLYFCRMVVLPIALAVMLSFFFKPMVKGLARFKIPQGVGAALVLLAALWIISNGVNQLAKPATDFVEKLPESLRQVEDKMRHLIWRAEQLTRAAAHVEDMTKGSISEKPATEVKVTRTTLADTLFSTTTSFIAGVLETIVLLYFLLAYGDLFLQKLVKVLPNFHEKKRAATITHELQQHISSFLFTVTVINTTLGI